MGFLHLGATKPRAVESINPWFLAGHDAETARRTLPLVFAPEERPQCGYFQAVIGTVPFACEDLSGAGGSLAILQESRAIASPIQDWREVLLKRLAAPPRPRSLQSFIRVCPGYGQWQFTPISDMAGCVPCKEDIDIDEEQPSQHGTVSAQHGTVSGSEGPNPPRTCGTGSLLEDILLSCAPCAIVCLKRALDSTMDSMNQQHENWDLGLVFGRILRLACCPFCCPFWHPNG